MEFHPHEISVLKNLTEPSSPQALAEKSGLQADAVLRASSWLKTKKLVEVDEKILETVNLGPEGVKYLGEGLPERQLLNLINTGMPLAELKGKSELHIFGIGFGWLKRKQQIQVIEGKLSIVSSEKTPDEGLIKKIGLDGVDTGSLSESELKALDMLKTRKNVVVAKQAKTIMIHPTAQGRKIASTLEYDNRLGQLTPEIIRGRSWEKSGFRPYDTRVFVKPEYPVKKHPVRRQINRIKRIFTSMGFTEISGPLVESAFWNFDALFQPQDHPARDMHDTFYLEKPGETIIDGFEGLKKPVSKMHEEGGDIDSTGWGYVWDEQTARKTLLRTHTTAVTARYLSKITPDDLPAKVFCLGKVFRNEAIDYKHLPEFYQIEGIVADPAVNFRNLLGILRQFYNEMGFEKVRFRPGYFPYTEMSVEPEVYLDGRGWIELGGAGIFRPEVVEPLIGIECPVLAWGLGLDRVVALSLGLNDIRQLYMSDLDWLKQN
jgi:phenylalanyl-tRNA synthetase alpha chain